MRERSWHTWEVAAHRESWASMLPFASATTTSPSLRGGENRVKNRSSDPVGPGISLGSFCIVATSGQLATPVTGDSAGRRTRFRADT
jgi:hypothetical protein